MTMAAADCDNETPVAQHDQALRKLLRVLKSFADLRGSIPLPYVTTFLTVAMDEGQGVCAYARAAGISRAAMSRYLRDIGDRARNGGPGLVLVKIQADPTDSRRRQVFLTTKGRSLANDVCKLMQQPARARRKSTEARLGAPRRNLPYDYTPFPTPE
jgi:DNA-binding MarR family transcriptional regulator